jgi:hypothetical protein
LIDSKLGVIADAEGNQNGLYLQLGENGGNVNDDAVPNRSLLP